MLDLLLALIPLAIGAALQPTQFMALILLLQTDRPVVNAWAFIGGMVVFHLGLGGIFWVLFTRVETYIETGGAQFENVVGTVLLLLGLMLLVYALRRIFGAEKGDEAAASWLEQLGSVTPIKAALVGFGLLALDPKDWLFTLAAVDLIVGADLGNIESLFAFLLFILMVQSLLITPTIYVMVAPESSKRRFNSLSLWLARNERAIEITVAIILGVYFVYVGLETLGVFS